MRPGDRMMPAAARSLPPAVAGPVRLWMLTGLSLAVAVTLLVAVVTMTDRGPDRLPGPDGDVVRVGVVEGQSVSGYLGSSDRELAALLPAPGAPAAGETWALVSLTAYLGPDKLPGVLEGAAVAQVYARVPLPQVRTQVVKIPVYRMPQDVVAGMLNAALARDQEQADYRKLGGELPGDGVDELRLRRAYDSAAQTAAEEAAAFRAHCACVFAAVVRADPAVLARVARRAEVRVVDPAPEVRQLDRTEFRPVLPEQTTTVREDKESSVPSQAVTVAPAGSAPLPSSAGAGVTSASPAGPVRETGPAATASEESAAVPPAPPANPAPGVPSSAPGASRSASGR
ncbi:hypothetical protein [Couchioplanes azureus]|uniref:hypothetical protein n=1 Tax=Couchioplanes caeruleus TaxID=56438 RepID=UPI00166F7B07|nr:hypothetical protein [Couchioplanes caeruleus]GGQ51841.1 hypothetical protein GCM10010166_20940 [Couchioplanes caeruleus subsp. azureus]